MPGTGLNNISERCRTQISEYCEFQGMLNKTEDTAICALYAYKTPSKIYHYALFNAMHVGDLEQALNDYKNCQKSESYQRCKLIIPILQNSEYFFLYLNYCFDKVIKTDFYCGKNCPKPLQDEIKRQFSKVEIHTDVELDTDDNCVINVLFRKKELDLQKVPQPPSKMAMFWQRHQGKLITAVVFVALVLLITLIIYFTAATSIPFILFLLKEIGMDVEFLALSLAAHEVAVIIGLVATTVTAALAFCAKRIVNFFRSCWRGQPSSKVDFGSLRAQPDDEPDNGFTQTLGNPTHSNQDGQFQHPVFPQETLVNAAGYQDPRKSVTLQLDTAKIELPNPSSVQNLP